MKNNKMDWYLVYGSTKQLCSAYVNPYWFDLAYEELCVNGSDAFCIALKGC